MPEYLAPGVFMEEVSYRSKSIEGVSTTTTGFVGPTRFGPVAGVPPLVTSYAEFEATYGDDADVAGDRNYLALGGPGVLRAGRQAALRQPRRRRANHAASSLKLTDAQSSPTLKARHPGRHGDLIVRIRLDADANSVRDDKAIGLRAHDVVLVTPQGKDARAARGRAC